MQYREGEDIPKQKEEYKEVIIHLVLFEYSTLHRNVKKFYVL